MSGHSIIPSDRVNKSPQLEDLASDLVMDILQCQVPFLLIYDMVPSYASLESIPSFWPSGKVVNHSVLLTSLDVWCDNMFTSSIVVMSYIVALKFKFWSCLVGHL
jgi:hypothetical protein